MSPRRKQKYVDAEKQPPALTTAPTTVIVAALTPYFKMRDGQRELGVSFSVLYDLYRKGKLPAQALHPGGALYVARADFDAMWEKKMKERAGGVQ
jgi:hypothetical protein